MDTITTETTAPSAPTAEKPVAEEPQAAELRGNGRVLGRVELPKPADQPMVVWFSCAHCGEKSEGIREEQAFVPNLNFIEVKLGGKVAPEDLKGFVLCRRHANALQDRDIRCYRYVNSIRFLEELVAGDKSVDAFVGDFGKHPATPAKFSASSAPLKTRPMEGIGTGRDFDSPQATKPRGKKPNNGGRRDKRRGWADRE